MFLLSKVRKQMQKRLTFDCTEMMDWGSHGIFQAHKQRLSERLIQMFKSQGLKITIESNLHKVNFLDVSLNLKSGRYWPYRKPNDSPIHP